MNQKYFAYHDRNNCKRTYDFILKNCQQKSLITAFCRDLQRPRQHTWGADYIISFYFL